MGHEETSASASASSSASSSAGPAASPGPSSSSGSSSPSSSSSAPGAGGADFFSNLPQDLIRSVIFPSLLPDEARALARVSHAAREAVTPKIRQVSPLEARMGDYHTAHIAIMQNEQASVDELRWHIRQGRQLREEISFESQDRKDLPWRQLELRRIDQLSRSAGNKLNDIAGLNNWKKRPDR